jgi:hypothetical protein
MAVTPGRGNDEKNFQLRLCFVSWDALMGFMLKSFNKPAPPKPETG